MSEDSQAFNFVINTECDYKCRLKVPLNWLRHYEPRILESDIKLN